MTCSSASIVIFKHVIAGCEKITLAGPNIARSNFSVPINFLFKLLIFPVEMDIARAKIIYK